MPYPRLLKRFEFESALEAVACWCEAPAATAWTKKSCQRIRDNFGVGVYGVGWLDTGLLNAGSHAERNVACEEDRVFHDYVTLQVTGYKRHSSETCWAYCLVR
jgi:hypothetical protein